MNKDEFNKIFRKHAADHMRESVLVEGKFNGLVPKRTVFIEKLEEIGLPGTGCIQRMKTIRRSGQFIFGIGAVYQHPEKGKVLHRLEISPESLEVFEDVLIQVPPATQTKAGYKFERVHGPGTRQRRAHPGLELYDNLRDEDGQQQARYGSWKNDNR